MRATGFVSPWRGALATGIALLLALSLAGAQQQSDQRIKVSFKEADITQVIEMVGAATKKNFIVDPRVRANVTVLSSTPMTPDAVYELFLSLLQVHGFIAVPAATVIKIP